MKKDILPIHLNGFKKVSNYKVLKLNEIFYAPLAE